MARKRLRNWPRKAYRYWVDVIGEPPQSLWDAAKAMRSEWNELVELHKALLAKTDRQKGEPVLEKPQKDELFKQFWRDVYATAKAHTELSTYAKWWVHDQFKATVLRFYQLKGGPPKFHGGLRQINLPFSFFDGGQPASWFKGNRIRIEMPPDAAYADRHAESVSLRGTRGWFTIKGKEQVPFKINVHRPLPEGCLLKRIMLTGRLFRGLGWRWALVIAIEYPPAPGILRSKTGMAAALDIGWRKFEDRVRVAVGVDSEGGAFEIAVPFELSNAWIRRYNQFQESKGSPARKIRDWRSLWQIQAEQDEHLKQTKAFLLSRYDEIPAGLRLNAQAFDKMKAGGLRRLFSELRKREVAPGVQTLLSDWLTRSNVYSRRMEDGRQSMIDSRNDMFGVIAARLAERYDCLVMEKLNLSELATNDDGNEALKAAQRYRQMASPYKLRQSIANACQSKGVALQLRPAEYSTQTCSECGGAIQSGPELFLCCENGHKMDQDINAARLLLIEELGGEWGSVRGSSGVNGFMDVRGVRDLVY